ncbi:MAG: hypothetical protein AB1476_06605 [Candidatus Hadarchaeota archaeon]
MGDEEVLLRRYLKGLGVVISRYRILFSFIAQVGAREKPFFVMGKPLQEDYPSLLEYASEKLKIHPMQTYRAKEALEKAGLIVNLSKQDPKYCVITTRGGRAPIYAVPKTSLLLLCYLSEAFQKFREAVKQ